MELMELTFWNGEACLVNPTQVMIAVDGERNEAGVMEGSRLYLSHSWKGGSRLFVKERLDEVAMKWARAMRVEEVE